MLSAKINNREVGVKWVKDHYITDDGVDFNGHTTLWSFNYEPNNYLKESELSGDEIRKGGAMAIFRNGLCVFREFCREPERAFRVLAYKLPYLQEFDWDCLIPGRKVYHAGVPSVIESVLDDGEIILRTEDGKPYLIYGHVMEELKEDPNYIDDWKDKDRVHVLDERISFHRS